MVCTVSCERFPSPFAGGNGSPAGAHCEAREIELRADPEGAWLAASAGLLTGRGEPEGLPLLLLLDGRGRLVALLQGELDLAIAGRFERWAEGLAPQVACQEVGP